MKKIFLRGTGRLAPARKTPTEPIDFKNFLFDLSLYIICIRLKF